MTDVCSVARTVSLEHIQVFINVSFFVFCFWFWFSATLAFVTELWMSLGSEPVSVLLVTRNGASGR